MTHWTTQGVVNLLVALSGVTTIMLGGLAAWKKLKPENTHIQVTTADSLVDIAVEAAGMVKVQRDELKAELDATKVDLRTAQAELHTVKSRLTDVERQAAECNTAREEALRDKWALQGRVTALEERLNAVTAHLRTHESGNPHEPD